MNSVTFAETTSPAGTEILKKLRPEHPRIWATEADFTKLGHQLEIDHTLQGWWKKVQFSADKMLTEPPPHYELRDGVRLLPVSREVLNRSMTLALAWRLTNDSRYRDRLWKEMEAVAQFPDWHPKHFLDTAEMTAAVAIAYDWLYDAWTPEQRKTIRQAIVRHGLTPALTAHRANDWWIKVDHNWNQVCNGGIGIGALAVAEDEPAMAAEFLGNAVRFLPYAMKQYAPDGAWNEGPGYWAYATNYIVYFLSALETATGSSWGLLEIPGFSLAGDFPLYMNGPSGKTFNFADAEEKPIHSPTMFWLAQKFNRPEYGVFEMAFAEKSTRPLDVLWGGEFLRARTKMKSTLPLNKWFRRLDAVALRGDVTDPRAFYVGFKAGSNAVNHGHLDCGSFVLDAFGKRWISDLGPDDYNLPRYFGPARWTYYRLRAESHNTLVLNPGKGPDQDPKATTQIEKFSDDPGNAFVVANLTAVYIPHAQSIRRGVALIGGKSVLVQDEISSEFASDLWWFANTAADVVLAKDGRSAILKLDGELLTVRLLAPEKATFEIRETVPLPDSPHPPKQFTMPLPESFRKLAIHLPDTTQVRIAVVFSAAKTPQPSIKPLANWR